MPRCFPDQYSAQNKEWLHRAQTPVRLPAQSRRRLAGAVTAATDLGRRLLPVFQLGLRIRQLCLESLDVGNGQFYCASLAVARSG